jgi:transcriptional regulator with GAF, ATPase, and Fis domain
MERSDRQQGLADVFVVLADSLQKDYEIVDTMDVLVEASTRFTAASEAGIVLADNEGVLHIVASTSERATDVEEEQLGAHDGPCFESFRTGVTIEVDDIAADAHRWPGFAEVALSRGFKSAHAVPLSLRQRTLGSLNILSDFAGPFDNREAALVQALAVAATISIVQYQTIRQKDVLTGQLQHALDSRILIEQAKGVIAQRRGISMNDAFAALRDYARGRNQNLRDVSDQIVNRRLTL